MEAYGPVVLRIVVGLTFAAHGMQKLFGVWDGPGLGATGTHFDTIGLSPGYPLAVAVAITESAGGLLLVLGALTRYAALALTVVMLGAIWKVHLAHGFFVNWAMTPGRGHGIEFNLVLIAALVCIALGGPGPFSVDERRARSAEAYAAGRARLRRKL